MSSVVYSYCGSLYVNMTNKCPNRCTFCVRNSTDSLGSADSLWLDREPTVDEICREFHKWNMRKYDEVVFCGYGEPTERFDAMLKVADHIHEKYNRYVRLNTNGLGCLINGRNIVPEMKGRIDRVNISLNAPDAVRYDQVCRSRFGLDAFPAILDFIRDCRENINGVTVSVVSGSITQAEEDECMRMASEMGVGFRSR